MAPKISRFQTWLLDKRSFVFSWFSSDRQETPEPEETLADLPPPLAEKLTEATQNLPSNPGDQEAVQSALDSALERWQSHPHTADNSLVMLSSPAAAVSRILTESIENWGAERQIPVRLLQWVARPSDPETFKPRLQKQLGRGVLLPSKSQEIIVISNLSWCFLRCIDGLDGVDYLRDVLLQDRSRFWLIGLGQVGWEYLDAVCHIKSYFSESPLPELDGEQLQKWLNPIISELGITFQPQVEPHSEEDQEDTTQAEYFEKLASVSEGISTVAVQVFLRSIHYESTGEDEGEGSLKAQSPSLPSLPSLAPDDYYVLYSLLLHGDLTIASLALSLGDDRAAVQSRVQNLRRAGVVEQQNEILRINPIHYPKLKSELANNNFIINESDT